MDLASQLEYHRKSKLLSSLLPHGTRYEQGSDDSYKENTEDRRYDEQMNHSEFRFGHR